MKVWYTAQELIGLPGLPRTSDPGGTTVRGGTTVPGGVCLSGPQSDSRRAPATHEPGPQEEDVELAAEAQADIRIEGDWPRILASPNELLRLLQNLLGNALKFRVAGRLPQITVTSSTGTIGAMDTAVIAATVGNQNALDSRLRGNDGNATALIAVSAQECEWQVCIADNGVGIAPGQIGRLFQVFARLHSRATYEGTGIGLALCRKIAEHHGGRIRGESEGEGQGSRFILSLPLATEPAAGTSA